MPKKFHTIVFYVSDYEKSLSYHRDKLGFEVEFEDREHEADKEIVAMVRYG